MYDQTYAYPPAQDPAGYPSAPPPEPERRHTGLLLAITAAIVVVLLAGGLALFGPFRAASSTAAAAGKLPSATGAGGATSIPDISVPRIDVPDVSVPDTDPVPTTDGPVVVPNGGPVIVSGGGTSGGGQTGGGAPTPPPTAPPAPKPAITSFTTPEDIDCHNGDFQMFTASWSTTDADHVTISIDGPGVYKTYGPTGSDSLPFNCSSPHTFLLTAYGHDGSTVSRSITLQPRNVQTPPADDQDAPDDI